MSTRTQMARPARASNELQVKLPFETTPNRTLVSAMGVLVGTGVVAMALGSPKAQAKSALDDLAWAPQEARLTKGAGVALTPLVTPAADTHSVQAAYAAPQAPIRQAALQPSPGFVGVLAEPAAAHAAAAARANFIQASISAPPPGLTSAKMVDTAPPRPAPVADTTRIGVATSPVRTAGTSGAASGLSRMPNISADLQMLRGSLATGANAVAVDASLPLSAAAPTGWITSSSQQTLDNRSALVAKRATVLAPGMQSSTHTVKQGYSDWLGDGSAARPTIDQGVVPEQAVRAALRSAADAAAARSPAVKQARNDWEAAKFDVDQAKGQRYPQVQVGANSPAVTGDSASFNQYNRPSASVAVTTLIYDWGKTSKTIDSRKKAADAAEFSLETIAQQNAYDVSKNLVDLAKQRAVYMVGDSYVKRMSQLVDMLSEIVAVDPGRRSELTQAKARLLQAQTSQEMVVTQLRTLQLALKKLVGEEPTLLPAGTHWQFQLDGLDSSLASVATNPAIEQAAAEAEAARLNAKSVRADGLPKLNWVINKNTAPDVFGNRQPWSTMLQLSWTPFQGGSQRAAERAALARADSSSDKRDQLALDSEFKVRDAHHDAIALAARARMYSDLATETDLIRKQFFEQWYHLNRRTLLDVLSAESDFYNNEVSAVTTQFDSYQAVLNIHLNNGTLVQWLQAT